MNWPTMEEMITKTHSVTSEQWAFLKSHDISLSNAYIGMLRAYHGNRTIWQTSWMAPFFAPRNEVGGIDFAPINAGLKTQLHEWIEHVMAMTTEDLTNYLRDTNLHLYCS